MNTQTHQIIEAPDLRIDKRLAAHYGPLRPDQKLERKIVANLIHFLSDKGFRLTHVDDEEENVPVGDAKEAMELLFDLDESQLVFQKSGHKPHWVLIVLGNGADCVADYSLLRDDADGFDAAMDEFFEIIEDWAVSPAE